MVGSTGIPYPVADTRASQAVELDEMEFGISRGKVEVYRYMQDLADHFTPLVAFPG